MAVAAAGAGTGLIPDGMHDMTLPHVSSKLSGLAMYHSQWSAQNCRVIFQTIVDAFGPSRVMLGSNFPVDKLFKSYSEVVDIWKGNHRQHIVFIGHPLPNHHHGYQHHA